MKLEIIKGRKPLTRLDTETAAHFIGKECYFSDDLDNFDYLDEFKDRLIVDGDYSNMYKGKLLGIFANDNAFIVDENDIGSRFDYCLPAEWVKEPEKKYRPYTLTEFVNSYSLGEEIILKRMNSNKIIHGLFLEYIEDNQEVRLGSYWYRFEELVNNYELYTGKGWKPFGIEEK